MLTVAAGDPVLTNGEFRQYAEHVRRYQEVFDRDRVRCILFDDLKNDPERTYRETLAFLGLEPAWLPEFKAHNERQRWRSQRTGRAMATTFSLVYTLCSRLPTRILRKSVLSTLGILFYLSARPNLTKARPSPISAALRDALRQVFREDVEQLAGILGRGLSSWLQPGPTRLGAPERRAWS